MTSSCGHDDKLTSSIKAGNVLTSSVIVSFSKEICAMKLVPLYFACFIAVPLLELVAHVHDSE